MAHAILAKLKKIEVTVRSYLDEKSFPTNRSEQTSLFRRLVFFFVLVVKRFVENRGILRASALAYTTLLALVPLIALGTTLLRDLDQKQIQSWIDKAIAKVAPALDLVPIPDSENTNIGENTIDSPESTTPPGDTPSNVDKPKPKESRTGSAQLSKQIYEYIQRANVGTLRVTGFLAIILVATALLSTIEKTFNDIWGVSQGRHWLKRVVYYWAVITLGPLVLSMIAGEHIQRMKGYIAGSVPYGQSVIDTFGKAAWNFSGFIIVCLAFAGLYIFMPNTRVNWRAALLGGFMGGTFWQLNNYFSGLYIKKFVGENLGYTKIYGALGLLPIFLVSLYLSWLFVLIGAQIAYVFQNFQTYLQEREADRINQHGREFIALRIMAVVGERFLRNQKPATAADLAEELSVSTRLVSIVTTYLLQSKLLFQATDTMQLIPARSLSQITIYSILEGVRSGRGHEPDTKDDQVRELMRGHFDRVSEAERLEGEKTTLDQLIRSALEVKGKNTDNL